MDHLLSRVLMEVEGGLQQRRPMREISIIRDHLESGDESLEMLGLTQLCDVLNMASPMTLSAIRPPVFVPLVIKCMKRENLDLVILAARVLTYMVDAISSSVYVLSAEGGIDVLLQNLTEIKDIELSEQCLTCLEKVTENSSCASILLQNMGVSVLLTFIDFFSTASQRKAWLSVVAMCRCITVETFGCVEGSLQDISARIDHDDNKISENAITSLCHIISGVSSDSELVARAFSGICRPLMSVLNRGDMSDSVFTSVLALLSAAIVHSAQVAREVMESGIVEWMFELIRSSSEQQQRLSLGNHTSRSEDTREPSIGTEDITRRETVEMPAQRERRLSVEQSKMLCLALTSLLPRVNTGYPKYSDTLSALVSEALDNGDDRVLGSLADDNGVVNDEEDDDDDSEDGVEDDDEGEEEEEDGEETQYTHEEVLTRAAEVGILLEKNELYKSCKLTHSCDGCGIRCSPTNWFRCNKCHDYDLCGKCLLSEWESHAVDGAMHSFCDMSDVLHKTGEPLKASEGTDEHINHIMSQREELYHQCPQLLALVLNGIPTMVTLFNESETHLVRSHCLVFIDRALALATPKQISEIKGLSEAALCEMIVTAMVDTSLVLNVQVMYLCRLLLEKNPEVYLQCFIHEGVTNSLVKIHERNKCYRQQPEEEQESPVGSDATHLKCPTTIANWRELLSIEATNLLAMFSSLSDDSRICRLKNVDTLLRENRLQEAFDTLRAVLLDDTTAYELSTTDVLHTLVEKLKSVNDIGAVVALSRTLAKQGSNSASPFARFVRLLQTALSYLDQFQPPTFSVVKSIHTQIPLRLVVHTPGSGTKQKLSTGASKSGQNNRSAPSAPRSSSSPAPSRETTTRRPTTRATPRQAAPSGRRKKDSPGFSSNMQGSGSGRGLSLNREVRVSVEPLTNLDALMAFIASNVLSGGSESNGSSGGGVRRRNDEDEVEEILPELANDMGADEQVKRKKLPQEKPRRMVYVRYGKYVLPPSLTILQLLQRYHTRSTSSTRKRNVHRGGGSASMRFLSLMEGIQVDTSDIVTLHYSTEPFGPEYVQVSTQLDVPLGTPADPVDLRLPSQSIERPEVLEVMRTLHNEYPFSKQYLSTGERDILTLLGVLHAMVRNWTAVVSSLGNSSLASGDSGTDACAPSISTGEFVHKKLNSKAMRHSSNLLLAGQHMSIWAVNLALDCNFLFSFMTRKYLFDVGFCGPIRSLIQMQESIEKYGVQDSFNSNSQLNRSYRLRREKKRVWRDKALACAVQIMGKERSSGSVVLEFEYYNENGSGSGPTMEFYMLVSDELRETKLNLWRRTDETPDEKYYRPHRGVYPRPIPPSTPELDKIEPYFLLLGRLMARAFLDKRILSIPLSPVLFKMLRGDTCGLHDLADISESLGASILAIASAAHNGTDRVQMPNSNVSCGIQDLCLDFTLPGDELVELVEGGASISVTQSNAMEYCDAITRFVLLTGVERVVRALRVGFHDYLPLYSLRMLTLSELYETLNGHPALVTVEELDANCQADHGYTLSSRQVRQLFEIIASFNEREQSMFFNFLTGSARLPAGGLANLRPKFTVVRKTSSDPNMREQEQLPSAMTCQNYLKLPAYETKEQMEEKLRKAISEGCGSFLLT